MRNLPATIILLATLTSTLVACDPKGPHSIGSLDDDTGGNTSGDDGICGPSLVDLEFEVSPDGFMDLRVTCAAEVDATVDGYRIELSNCTDSQGMPETDITVTLVGDWSEPPVDGEPEIELRHVQVATVIDEVVSYQRWLSLRSAGADDQLLLVAVDAISTYPNAFGEFEFDYGPLAIDPVSTDCPLIENVACAPIEPGALVVSIEDEPFTIAEGRESTIVHAGESYHVVVEETHSLVDDCPDHPPAEYMFGIVASAPI
jgi:hypothetical protein